MVMEKEYGPEKMRRFLKYELDNYLRGRGTELLEEERQRGSLTLRAPAADLRKFDVDDVAQLRLRVIGDPDHGDVAFLADPFMVFRETQHGHQLFSYQPR